MTAWLRQDWSPAIISACLKRRYPRDPRMRISPETLYQWSYADARAGGRLYEHLWSRRKRRRRRRARLKGPSISHRVSIDQRPAGANNRSRYGHWEGDTMEGARGTGGLATHIERKSRFLIAGLLTDKRAETFRRVTRSIMGWVPRRLRLSNTLDNGTENAQHQKLSQQLAMAIYFADPYAPWQRGTNEQTNGLLRRYFPKGTDMRKLTQAQVNEVVEKINKPPRKCLGYRTPYEVFAEQLRGALGT